MDWGQQVSGKTAAIAIVIALVFSAILGFIISQSMAGEEQAAPANTAAPTTSQTTTSAPARSVN